jgi:hypothetical protein
MKVSRLRRRPFRPISAVRSKFLRKSFIDRQLKWDCFCVPHLSRELSRHQSRSPSGVRHQFRGSSSYQKKVTRPKAPYARRVPSQSLCPVPVLYPLPVRWERARVRAILGAASLDSTRVSRPSPGVPSPSQCPVPVSRPSVPSQCPVPVSRPSVPSQCPVPVSRPSPDRRTSSQRLSNDTHVEARAGCGTVPDAVRARGRSLADGHE